MWRSKKLLLVVLLAVLAIVGTTAGIAFADEGGDEGEGDATTRCEQLLDRVCAIYEENTGVAIDPDQLQDAFAQARGEKMTERLESHLQELVEQGKLTQEEADEYLEWWQARPDTPLTEVIGRGFRFGCRIMEGRCLHSGAVVWIPKACS